MVTISLKLASTLAVSFSFCWRCLT
jgi:hypothetical protein